MGLTMSGDVQLWPLALGWIVVSLLALFGLRRQAMIAAAGMSIVTYVVLSVAFKAV